MQPVLPSMKLRCSCQWPKMSASYGQTLLAFRQRASPSRGPSLHPTTWRGGDCPCHPAFLHATLQLCGSSRVIMSIICFVIRWWLDYTYLDWIIVITSAVHYLPTKETTTSIWLFVHTYPLVGDKTTNAWNSTGNNRLCFTHKLIPLSFKLIKACQWGLVWSSYIYQDCLVVP